MDEPVEGVKVLSEKTGNDYNFQNDISDSELVPAGINKLTVVFRSAADELRSWKEMRI